MKLYMHPVSTTSRPIRLLIAEKKLPVEEQIVDLMTGEHVRLPYVEKNPNKLVPMIEEGSFRLTESSAILKYLASKFELPEYPTQLEQRAKVDESMDWFNTQFYRDYAYGLLYPQMFPHHKRPTPEIQDGVIAWGRERAKGWIELLDEHWIGPQRDWLANDRISIADYFGSCLLTVGEVVRCDFSGYRNVSRWLGNMSKLDSWGKINEALHGFKQAVKDQPFQAL